MKLDSLFDENKKFNFSLNWIAIILIVISLVMAVNINIQRIKAENADNVIGLVADYDELLYMSNASKDLDYGGTLDKFHRMGITGVLVRERLLSDWVNAGDAIVLTGAEMELSEMKGQKVETYINGDEFVINRSNTYILIESDEVFNQIYSILETKKKYPKSFEFGEFKGIEVYMSSVEMANTGLGYPIENLKTASELGINVIVRVRNWAPVNKESIECELNWISQIPGIAAIGFNDAEIPGSTASNTIELLRDEINRFKLPIVSFEFYDQTGLNELSMAMDNNIIRVHSIAENELSKYDTDDSIDRFNLAVNERNIRYIYLHYKSMKTPVTALASAVEYTQTISNALELQGYELGNPVTIKSPEVSFWMRLILGLGIFAAGGKLVALGLNPITKGRYMLLWVIVLGFGYICWAGLLSYSGYFGMKIAALAASIVFPTLSVSLIFKDRNTIDLAKKSILKSIISILVMSLITFAGAMIMSAMLCESSFMMKTQSFIGVKVAHIVPLLLIPCILWLREENWKNKLVDAMKSPLFWWQAVACLFAIVILAIYVTRTGNDADAVVTGVELKFRQILTDVFGVRPRTKEFIIGHPIMLALIYYGYKKEIIPLLELGIIGQVSLINTYAHIHTPLIISLRRSFNGMVLGIILGVCIILFVNLVIKFINKKRGA